MEWSNGFQRRLYALLFALRLLPLAKLSFLFSDFRFFKTINSTYMSQILKGCILTVPFNKWNLIYALLFALRLLLLTKVAFLSFLSTLCTLTIKQ